MGVHNNGGYYLKCTEAYVRVQSRLRLRKQGLKTPKCDRRSAYKLTVSKLDKLTIEALMARAEDMANSLKEDIPSTIAIPPRMLTLEDHISQLKKLSKTMSDLDSVIQKKQLELNELKAKHSQNDDPALIVRKNKLKDYGKNYGFWYDASFQDELYLFNQFIERIDCYEGVPHRFALGISSYLMPQLMADFIDWLNLESAQNLHPLEYAATSHYRFVSIHPF